MVLRLVPWDSELMSLCSPAALEKMERGLLFVTNFYNWRLWLNSFIWLDVGCSSTQSIGLLSYTFLRSTGKEDIVVPMVISFSLIVCCWHCYRTSPSSSTWFLYSEWYADNDSLDLFVKRPAWLRKKRHWMG